MLVRVLIIFTVTVILYGCGDSETPDAKESIAEIAKESIEDVKSETSDAMSGIEEDAVDAIEDVVHEKEQAMNEVKEESVATMEEIETHAKEAITDLQEQVATAQQEVESAAEMMESDASAAIDTSGKPYQLVDGQISQNAIEGWKTYNGGGCGACHGKGGIGAVGPNLGVSVTEKLTKEQFVDVVTNGRSGTMMRPHKTNTRVMENLDNLYAYLVARGDDVLGPGNLIKSPLGK